MIENRYQPFRMFTYLYPKGHKKKSPGRYEVRAVMLQRPEVYENQGHLYIDHHKIMVEKDITKELYVEAIKLYPEYKDKINIIYEQNFSDSGYTSS